MQPFKIFLQFLLEDRNRREQEQPDERQRIEEELAAAKQLYEHEILLERHWQAELHRLLGFFCSLFGFLTQGFVQVLQKKKKQRHVCRKR